jgi:hypothetical protein
MTRHDRIFLSAAGTAAVLGVATVAVAFALATGTFSDDGGANQSSIPSQPQQQYGNQSSAPPQPQQPAALTASQKGQIKTQFCHSQMNGSEAALIDCTMNYYVTDQGMVLRR